MSNTTNKDQQNNIQVNNQSTKSPKPKKRQSKWVISAQVSQHYSIQVQQNLAQKLARQGDWTGAIALLTQLIHLEPQNPIHYNNRGLLHFQNGNHAKALKDYNYALELNPNLDNTYNNRANYYAARQEYWLAIADYEMSIEINPLNTRAWINLGITYRDLGLYQLAQENFDTALLFRQLEGNIYAERGRTHHLEGDWNWAIADYQKALTYLSIEGDHHACCQVKTWMQQLLSPAAP